MHEEKGKSGHNYFTRATTEEYEGLYWLDVLEVEDKEEFDQNKIKKTFLKNTSRKQNG